MAGICIASFLKLQSGNIKIYKPLNSTNPSFMQECFVRKDTKYDLRTKDLLQIPPAKSIRFGIDSIKFRGSLLWNSMPDLINPASSAAMQYSKEISKIGMETTASEKFVNNDYRHLIVLYNRFLFQ